MRSELLTLIASEAERGIENPLRIYINVAGMFVAEITDMFGIAAAGIGDTALEALESLHLACEALEAAQPGARS